MGLYRCKRRTIVLSLVALTSLVVLSFSLLYSQSQPVTIYSVENEPRALAVNNTTSKAVVTNHSGNSITIADISTLASTTITVGQRPYGVAVSESANRAYVVNEKSGGVSVVDLATNTVTATIPVGENPKNIALNPDTGVAVVTNTKSDTVSVLDLAANQVVKTIAVGADPEGVAINAVNNRAFVTNAGADRVTVIDLYTKTVTTTVPVGKKPTGIAIHPQTQKIVVTNRLSNTASIIDGANNMVIATLTVGTGPAAVAIDTATNRAYVSNTHSDSVSVIDLSANTVVSTWPVGLNPKEIAVVPQRNLLLTVNDEGDAVYSVDLLNPPFGTISPVGKDPQGIAIDLESNVAVTANAKSDNLSVVDLSTGAILSTVTVGKEPVDVALHPVARKLVAANYRSDSVSVVDLSSRALLATVPVGKSPSSVAIDPALNIAAVANERDGTVSLVDLSNYSVTAVIPAGTRPVDIAVNTATHIAVVADQKTNTARVIDLASKTAVASISVGRDPLSVAINPATNMAMVVNEDSDSLTLINLSTLVVSATIPVTSEPNSVAVNPSTNIAVVAAHENRSIFLVDLATNAVTSIALPQDVKPEQVAVNPYTNVAAVTSKKNGTVTTVQLPNPVPALNSIVPATADAGAAGFTLSLSGQRFLKTSTVKFGTKSYTPRFVSNEQLTVDIPAADISQSGSLSVSVINPTPGGGTSNSLTFIVNSAVPILASISPLSITAGGPGFTLSVNGSNFASGAVVSFNGQALITTVISASQLSATVPVAAVANAGEFPVTVTNPGGNVSNAIPFIVNNPVPTVTSVTPSSIAAGLGATLITVSGGSFVGSSVVHCNGTALATSWVNAGQLTATIPANLLASAGTLQLAVVNPVPGGGVSNAVNLIVNTPPVADAGRATVASVGKAVALDGRNSADADSDLITFAWNIVSAPAGSAAALVNAGTATPRLVPDVNGDYRVRLVVNDGKVDSAPSEVTVSAFSGNTPPAADAGPDQTAVVGQSVTLDGRKSGDVDGDKITYHWSVISAPSGSIAALSDTTSVIPTFTPDQAGDYWILLAVNDGTVDGAPDVVKITAASANAAPLARAGKDRSVLTGGSVTLDGSGSSDPNGDALTYGWAFISMPAGSAAALFGASTSAPSFIPDIDGDYVVRLTVNDGTMASAPDTVIIRANGVNPGPNALTGPDQTVSQSDTVTLDGAGSADPNGDALTYNWSIVSLPSGSTAVLSDSSAVKPTFVADRAGEYVVRLTVNDGVNTSLPATVVITARPIKSLAVAPAGSTIVKGQQLQFTATATLADDSTRDVTSLVNWSSSDPAVAAIDDSGLTTALKAGAAQITAAYGPITSPPQTLTVINPAPAISGFTPASGVVGTVVTISGANFDASVPSNNKVSFNGTPSIVTAVNAGAITTTVPMGASTGPITVTTTGGTATSATLFTVTPKEDFSISAAPALASVVQGKGITWQVKVNDTGQNSMTSLVGLSISGLPAGATASFSPAKASSAQGSTLTLQTSSSTPSGAFTITVSGSAALEGKEVTRTADVQVNVLAASGTTLSGRVLASKDDTPVAGATLKLGSLTAVTDESGNFYFAGPPIGDQVILAGGPAGNGIYPDALPIAVTIAAGVDNDMPYPVYLHEISKQYTEMVPGQETTINPPNIPDFSVFIPQGTSIIGWDGQPNTKMSVTAISPDRIPIKPIPADVQTRTVYMFNFGKPGGGFPSRPIPIVYPNDLGAEPGERIDLWYYDESATPDPNSNQWRIYGQGTVSQDGKLIVPDPGVGQPKFCCGAGFPSRQSQNDPQPGAPDAGDKGGDPVDLSSGLFVLDKTDMILPGIIPVEIKRTYRTQSRGMGIFGIGASFNYDLYLRPSGSYAMSYLMPDGGRYTFSMQPDGSYTNDNFPFLKGTVVTRFTDGRSQMRFRDGRVHVFNSAGWLIEERDRNNNRVVINRDALNRITSIAEPSGRALSFEYITVTRGRSSFAVISSITDPIGRVVRYGYTPQGMLITVTDPAGGVTTYTYDGNDRIVTITDARGITYITNEYDTSGRVIRQTLADGGVYTFNYTTAGNAITQTVITDPNGNSTTYRFNNRQYIAREIDAQGQMTRYEHDFATNQLTAVYDSLNRKTSYTYDTSGNLTSVIDPNGNPTIMEYEPTYNRLAKTTNALNQTTIFAYDANGNLISTTDPMGNVTTIASNAQGQPTAITDALGNVTRFEYDEQGNLISSTDPMGNRSTRQYDAISRMVSVTGPTGKSALFAYNLFNRVERITDAAHGLTQFTYDSNGNLLSLIDAKGQTTTYAYNGMAQVISKVDPLGRTESFSYDPGGNRKTFTDRKGQTTLYSYDSLDRRVRTDFADGSWLSRDYDTVSRLRAIADSIAGSIQYHYDNLDRVTEETTSLGTISYAYDVIGRRTSMTVNGQQPVTYSYDSLNRLLGIVQGAQSVSLGYDAIGRRTSLTYPNGTSTSYTYDAASRLANMRHQGSSSLIESLTYGYDAAGNRISLSRTNGNATLLPPAVQAAYDAANEQVQFNSNTPNLTYDANGNLAGQTDTNGMTAYTWDARNRLVGINGPTVTASFVYDAFGRRTSKIINGNRTDYQYDGHDIVVEYGSGAVGATYLRNLNIDEPFVRQSTAMEYYHSDALGSAIALTDETGTVRTTYQYEPFGKTTTTGTSGNPFKYTGREEDEGTGLYYYRARYYSPQLQRFIAQDPIGFTGGDVNLYGYVGQNPVNWVDPQGLFVMFCPIVASAIVDALGATIGITTGAIIGQQIWDNIVKPLLNENEESGYKEAERKGKGQPLDIGNDLTDEEAFDRGNKGQDVQAPSEEKAEELARRLGGGKEPVQHDPHGTDPPYKPHYHPAGKKTHIFY